MAIKRQASSALSATQRGAKAPKGGKIKVDSSLSASKRTSRST